MTDKNLILNTALKATEKLIHFGGADYSADRDIKKEDTSKGLIARDAGIEEWDWPQGVGIMGIQRLNEFFGDGRYDNFLDEWFLKNIERGLPSANINTTIPYLTLADFAGRRTEYKNLCIERAQWLKDGLPKTEDGGFQHVTTAIGDRNAVTLHEGLLWIDSLFMAALFLGKMGAIEHRRDWVDEAVKQFLVHIKYIYDKKTGLFFHGWDFNRRNNYGEVHWARGNCWATLGIPEFLRLCGNYIDGGVREFLTDTFKAQAAALINLQDDTGLWHTVLDDSTSYIETSGSAGICAGLIMGIKQGILGEKYIPAADRALKGLCDMTDADGTVKNVSGGTGAGMDAEHYKRVALVPRAYGQALVIIALCEGLKL